MRKFKFDDIHRSKKHAFFDGLLSGLALVFFAFAIKKNR